jgi:hypothetical protein
MKFAAPILAMLGSAAAFAPTSQNMAVRTNTVSMNLWGEPNQKDGESGEKSQALPFSPRPKLLDGTLAGDVGFE